jgi:hypothetical protein
MAASSSSMVVSTHKVSGYFLHISLLIYLQVKGHCHYVEETPLTPTGSTRVARGIPQVLLLVSKEEKPRIFSLIIIHSVVLS